VILNRRIACLSAARIATPDTRGCPSLSAANRRGGRRDRLLGACGRRRLQPHGRIRPWLLVLANRPVCHTWRANGASDRALRASR
jgi:hypothetical protein